VVQRALEHGGTHALAAGMARVIARMALAALGLSGDLVHEPVHVREPASPASCYLCVNIGDDMDPRPQADMAPGPTVDRYAATHTVRLAGTPICRDTDAGELPLHTALRGADQLIRWAKFTMNPSGPRTDAMRQMSSY
jgi:hypothetical protein